MARFSNKRKSEVLKKLLPPHNMTVSAVAKEEGISEATLYNWRKQAKQRGEPVPGNKPTAEHWSAETKLATVATTAIMSEAELSEYCRQKGLYVEQVKQWRQMCLSGFDSHKQQDIESRKQAKADKAQIKALERDLRRKDKALAETTALLVLRKKLDALLINDDEGN